MQPLQKIASYFEKYSNEYHIFIEDFRTNKLYEIGNSSSFPIASSFKLGVLTAVVENLKRDEDLDIEIEVNERDWVGGSGLLQHFPFPSKYSIRELLTYMHSHSDNIATDVLIKRVGLGQINKSIRMFGVNTPIANNIQSMLEKFFEQTDIGLIKVEGKQREIVFEDVTDAIELSKYAKGAYNYIPSSISRQSYLDILRLKRSVPRLEKYFPDSIRLIGKTGTLGLGYFLNDCGVLEKDGKAIGAVGIASKGFLRDREIDEICFGLVGLEILRLLNIEFRPNLFYLNSNVEFMR